MSHLEAYTEHRAAKKRGRPPKQGMVRYESGRVDVIATERRHEIVATAKRNRMKLPGVTEENAATELAGTALGRLFLTSQISEAQYRAGLEYAKRRVNYLAAISAPRSPRSGSDLGYLRERLTTEDAAPVRAEIVRRSDADEAEYAAKRRALFAEVRAAVMMADPLGDMVMQMVACEDKEPNTAVTLGVLRVACNAVARLIKQGA